MERSEQIILKSQKSELHKVVAFVENICDQHNIYNNYYGNIVTAITEAFLNAVEHGNKNIPEKDIKLSFDVESDGFMFCISDQGDGFDIQNINDPTDINSEDTIHGRGIFLINALSDKVEFKNEGTQVCMKFLISSINREVSDRRIEKLKAFMTKEVKHNEHH
jgi:serine/threonine-protein kinase RsbW